jgi:hypothetical protein
MIPRKEANEAQVLSVIQKIPPVAAPVVGLVAQRL